MRPMIRNFSLLTLTLLLSACDGPFIFMAGGALSGAATPAPVTWQLDEASAVAQLETNPSDPYSINLTYVQLAGRMYAYAGDTRTNWVQNIEQSPLVRLRVGETVYEARAERVTSEEELAEFAEVWSNLSPFQRDPHQFDEVWLYRLEAR